MPTLNVRAQTDGMQRVQDDFDGLTRKQQKLILESSQVGKEFDRMQKKLDGAGQSSRKTGQELLSMNNLLKVGASLAGGLGASFGVMEGAQQLVKQTRLELERYVKVTKEAEAAGTKRGQGIGGLLLNAGDLAADPAALKRVTDQLQDIAITRGRTPEDTLAAFTSMRPQTPGATDEQRLAALDAGFKAKQLNEGFDAPGFAAALVSVVQESERNGQAISMDRAADKFFALADRFGGDTNAFGAPLARMAGLTSTGVSLDELGGALAFGVASTKKTPEAVIEGLAPLLTKLAAEDQVEIGRRKVRLEGADPIDKLLNFLDRLDAGEFGTNRAAAIDDLIKGGGGVNTQLLLGQIIANRAGFEDALQAGITAAPNQLETRYRATVAADPAFAERVRTTQAAASATAANVGDIAGASQELQAQRVLSFAQQFGLNTDEGNFFKQLGYTANPFAAFGQDTLEGEVRARIKGGASASDLESRILYNQLGDIDQARFSNRRAAFDAAGEEGGVQAQAMLAFTEGFVNLNDGVQRQEAAILRVAGFSESLITEMSRNSQAVLAAIRERDESNQTRNRLLAEMAELMRTRSERPPTPAPGATDPGP